MLRLSACTADCVLGCDLIETAHIHNSSSSSTSSLPQPPFCITCRRSRMCPQRTTAAISCCNLGQDTSTLCTVGFQKVVSARCFWYVPLSLCALGQRLSCAASKFIFTSRKYLVYTHIHTHSRSSGSYNSSEIISPCSGCTWVSFSCSGNYFWPVSLRCLQLCSS